MNKKQLQKMLQQAQSVQEKLEEEMNNLTIEASSGGGMVTAVVDGRKNLKSITIKPEAVDPDDVEMLQDLILAAVNEASRKADEVLNSQLGGLTGGLLGGLG
ncbi:MAG: YbaB/EbfC family nucleoid-associated protein [Acidobacteriota bacterium]|jgi:DNA-binding YbaB/EbfC family protein